VAESKFINPLFRSTEAPRSFDDAPDKLRAPHSAHPRGPLGPDPTVDDRAGPEAMAQQAPVKFTFYFMPDQLERLDNLWLRVKLDHRERLNKSEFVRLALARLMEEFDRDPKGVLAELRRQRAS